jgi:hypothetical protein
MIALGNEKRTSIDYTQLVSGTSSKWKHSTVESTACWASLVVSPTGEFLDAVS